MEQARSFEDFYAAAFGGVARLAFQLTGRSDVAEELAQDAFARALARWSRVREYDRPDLWVRRVAINLAHSRVRRVVNEARLVARLGRSRPTVQPPPEIGWFVDAVRQLPPRQAAVVALYYGDDLSVADIAAVLECAPGTVKALLSQARARLALAATDPANTWSQDGR